MNQINHGGGHSRLHILTGFRLDPDGGAAFMADAEGKPTVLVVDDEEMVRSIATQMLEKLDYHVVAAASGADAIKTFEQQHERIDLVILDMIMPGMGGGETFDRIKKINGNVPIMLSSGYSIDGQAKEIMDRGCSSFIQKPFTLEELSWKVREALVQRKSEGQQ